jgi:toxin ParE1/3/4
VTSAVLRIVETPGAGALCDFKSTALRGLRRISLAGFPKHLLFYEFKEKKILVLRVLHGARDLESLL